MRISQKAHEWAAGRFSFVQYPRIRRIKAERDWVDTVLRVGVFTWLMWVIWGAAIFWVILVPALLFW